MEEQLLVWFECVGILAFLLSIVLNIIISILGVVPSVFLTAANISFFGLWYGLILSILGEAVGAVISFFLYRKGIHKFLKTKNVKHKWLQILKQANGKEAFFLVLGLRIFPFMPSGAVTLAGAGSKMSLINFTIASTIGKIPALMIEAYSVYHVLNGTLQGKIILSVFSIFILLFLFFKKK